MILTILHDSVNNVNPYFHRERKKWGLPKLNDLLKAMQRQKEQGPDPIFFSLVVQGCRDFPTTSSTLSSYRHRVTTDAQGGHKGRVRFMGSRIWATYALYTSDSS
jgi:hypothetical protein